MNSIRGNHSLIGAKDYDEPFRGWTHTQEEGARYFGHRYERWALSEIIVKNGTLTASVRSLFCTLQDDRMCYDSWTDRSRTWSKCTNTSGIGA